MANERKTLPSYANPPVVETVLEVDFGPLPGWGIPHFGLFWNQIRQDYPKFEVQPLILSPADRLSEEDQLFRTIMVDLTHQPPVRCWFIEESGSRMLQLQNDRFVHNWRKIIGTEPYPRYEYIRPIFEQEWSRFRAFLQSNDFPAPQVKECEVTYVNHIERGHGWETFADLSDIVRCWADCKLPSVPMPNAVAFNIRYALPDNEGTLSIQCQPAIRMNDRKEILQLNLAVRCRPKSGETVDVLTSLDQGREFVVKAFSEITSPKMHQLWQREDAQ